MNAKKFAVRSVTSLVIVLLVGLTSVVQPVFGQEPTPRNIGELSFVIDQREEVLGIFPTLRDVNDLSQEMIVWHQIDASSANGQQRTGVQLARAFKDVRGFSRPGYHVFISTQVDQNGYAICYWMVDANARTWGVGGSVNPKGLQMSYHDDPSASSNGGVTPPSQAQLKSMLAITQVWMAQFGIPAEQVVGHREVGSHADPTGVNMDAVREQLRNGELEPSPIRNVEVPVDWGQTAKVGSIITVVIVATFLLVKSVKTSRRLKQLEQEVGIRSPRRMPQRPSKRYFVFGVVIQIFIWWQLKDMPEMRELFQNIAYICFGGWGLFWLEEKWARLFGHLFGWEEETKIVIGYLALFPLACAALARLLVYAWFFAVLAFAPSPLQVSLAPAPSVEAGGPLYVGVYGHLGPSAWGTLENATTAEEAVKLAEDYAQSAEGWTDRQIVPLVNVVLRNEDDGIIQGIIDLCAQRGCVVMLDISPQENVEQIIARWAQSGSHVWMDLDVEHNGSPIPASTFNRYAKKYFDLREQAGYGDPGVFAFYDFRSDPWIYPEGEGENRIEVRFEYPQGLTVPIYDGHCKGELPYFHDASGEWRNPCRSAKWNATNRVFENYSEASWYGAMEFFSRFGCGSKYGDCGFTPQEYFEAFKGSPLLIYLAQ
ncbi:peptidoglycan recognition protein family protein [Patescibacteria group bacterium]|nr:peptidoglycan recognition protein family protein [Patescibacteria group bacterium]